MHWTLLRIYYFLHHPQMLHCLEAITKYRNMHAHLCLLCWRDECFTPRFFGCVIETSLITIPSFIKIRPLKLKYNSLFTALKDMHVYLGCASISAGACAGTLSINSGDQF